MELTLIDNGNLNLNKFTKELKKITASKKKLIEFNKSSIQKI